MLNELEFKETVKNMQQSAIRMEREGDYWSTAEDERISTLFDGGTGITEIAIILQRTEQAVAQQIEKLDLYQRKENPQRQKSFTKEPVCLCPNCRLDPASCPHRTACGAEQEGI